MIGGLWKSTSSVALLAAAGMYLGSAGLSPAQAADLGGSCCADLEERVAELEATTARKGNRRVSLTISGQVSTAIMAWDAGDELQGADANDIYVVDGTYNGGTQFRFNGSARINPALTAGFEIAIGIFTGARSHQVNQFDDDGGNDGDSEIVMTRANWYLGHRTLGTLRVGRINTATAGVSTVNLGGTGVVANASIGYWQRGFFDPETGLQWTQLLGGNPVNGASLSRANAISYTSPTFGGFSVAAAWGEDDIWDVALRYAGEYGGFRVAGAIGYINNSTGVDEAIPDDVVLPPGVDEPSQIKGSASILHVASGLYLAGSYVNQDNGVDGLDDTTLWYAQGGISKNWTGLGKTAVYGEYANVDSPLSSVFAGGFDVNSEADMWGLGLVQHVDAAAMELYLSYRNYSAEADDVDADDFSVVLGGARIRF